MAWCFFIAVVVFFFFFLFLSLSMLEEFRTRKVIVNLANSQPTISTKKECRQCQRLEDSKRKLERRRRRRKKPRRHHNDKTLGDTYFIVAEWYERRPMPSRHFALFNASFCCCCCSILMLRCKERKRERGRATSSKVKKATRILNKI